MNVRQIAFRMLVTAVVALTTASTAHAQQSSLAVTPTPIQRVARHDSTEATSSGPTREAAAVAVHARGEVNRTPAPAAGRGFSHGETLMIVGGAAILTGIVVGNDAGHAISVAGAVIGLIGLYQYLQ